jgi:hypothetical protein
MAEAQKKRWACLEGKKGRQILGDEHIVRSRFIAGEFNAFVRNPITTQDESRLSESELWPSWSCGSASVALHTRKLQNTNLLFVPGGANPNCSTQDRLDH